MTKPLQPIFIFSLPRSGSTFFQRLLATQEEIASTAEPWLLLPFLYGLRREGIYTEYWQKVSVQAMEDFIDELPGGRDDYDAALRDFLLGLYRKAAGGQAVYFLDKTPRYHLVVDEIQALFPDAKCIFLWRNPLSVIASMMKTFSNERWNLHLYKTDLYTGLPRLAEAWGASQDRSLAVNYERLVQQPEVEMKRVMEYLEIPWSDAMIEAFAEVSFSGRMGDPTGIKEYSSISREPLEKWAGVICNPIRKAWCRRYVRALGPELWESIGYNQDELLESLNASKTSLRYLFSDLWKIMLGVLWSVINPKSLKDNVRKFPALRKMRIHY